MLETLKHELNEAQVYHWSQVEAFGRVFYKPPEQQTAADHAAIERQLQPAVDRFKALDDGERREEFRARLDAYVRLYAFLSQIIPYADVELEMLYSFGRLLLPHLPADRTVSLVKLGDDVELRYYRLQRISSGRINLREEGGDAYVKSPTAVGTGTVKDEEAPLSEIIRVLNDRFGTEFTEADALLFEQIKAEARADQRIVNTALANPLDKFELGIRRLIEELMIDRMAGNDKIVSRYMSDPQFQAAAFPILARQIFDAVRRDKADQAPVE